MTQRISDWENKSMDFLNLFITSFWWFQQQVVLKLSALLVII